MRPVVVVAKETRKPGNVKRSITSVKKRRPKRDRDLGEEEPLPEKELEKKPKT